MLPLLSKQQCYPATKPNSYRSLSRYHFNVRLTLTSPMPHLIRGHKKLGKQQAAGHMMDWDQGVCIAP